MAKPRQNVDDFGLSDQQRRFLELIFAGGQTQAECYKAAGYKSKTHSAAETAASKLLKNDKSRNFLRHLRQQAHEALINRYMGAADSMIQVLIDVASASDSPQQTRVSAAKAVLDGAASAYKSGIQDEAMAELEQRIEQITGES
jgi:hypothetical protein